MDGDFTMKRIMKYIPALLWLILSICHYLEGNLKKSIIFMACAVGLTVVEVIFSKWQNNKM